MSKASEKARERAEALERFRSWGVKPGTTLYTVLRHVSRSGMMRTISVVGLDDRPDAAGRDLGISDYSWNVAKLGLGTFDRERDGVKVSGCGMDMGFHLVYSLSRTLFPTGFGCIGKGCPSNDHSNGDRDYTPHGQFTPHNAVKLPNGLYDEESQSAKHWHNDGGYALKQRWL